jgi:hypothetical protein
LSSERTTTVELPLPQSFSSSSLSKSFSEASLLDASITLDAAHVQALDKNAMAVSRIKPKAR